MKLKKLFFLYFSIIILYFSNIHISYSQYITKNIQIYGLHHINKNSIINHVLKIINHNADSKRIKNIIYYLHESKIFESVRIKNKNGIFIIYVVEKPIINSVVIIGNKSISNKTFQMVKKKYKLINHCLLDKCLLNNFKNHLLRMYYNIGKFNASVKDSIYYINNNKVNIMINIYEGYTTKIKKIDFFGNKIFSNKIILYKSKLFKHYLYHNNNLLFSKKNINILFKDLKNFYINNGYLKFNIKYYKIRFSRDKRYVYITIFVQENDKYYFKGYKITGNKTLIKKYFDKLIHIKYGEVFSAEKLENSTKNIYLKCIDLGYLFPLVKTHIDINKIKKTIFVNFNIYFRHLIYVRRINFYGNRNVSDYILRNIMLQNEGSIFSSYKIKESERRIRLLEYIKDIDIQTNPVFHTNNQVDINVFIEESPSEEVNASLGYGTDGPQLNIFLQHHNFFGTGRAIGVIFNITSQERNYSFNYYNPFCINRNIGQGMSIYYKNTNPKNTDISTFSSVQFGGDMNYNIPISYKYNVQFSYGYQDLNIRSSGKIEQIEKFLDSFGNRFRQIRLFFGFNHNTYDKFPFPNHGINQQINFLFMLPTVHSSLFYYKIYYQGKIYYLAINNFILMLSNNIGYGNSFTHSGFPFFENYYAGGNIPFLGQVRGYENYSLGPKDNKGRAIGSNTVISNSFGIILPNYYHNNNIRTTIFLDMGNVFSYKIPNYLSGKHAGPFRYSIGISIEWNSPFGPIMFSFSKPINKQKSDKQQIFQFSISSGY